MTRVTVLDPYEEQFLFVDAERTIEGHEKEFLLVAGLQQEPGDDTWKPAKDVDAKESASWLARKAGRASFTKLDFKTFDDGTLSCCYSLTIPSSPSASFVASQVGFELRSCFSS